MIRRVKDFNPDLMKNFPNLKKDSLYIQKAIGGVLTKDESTNDNGLYTSTGYVTTLDIDRDRDVIMPKGINWKEYDKNNVVLHMHGHWELPIGKCTKLALDPIGWKGTTKYFVNEAKDSQGFKNWEYRNAGFPLGRSIGFAPTEYAINEKYGEEFEKGWKDAYDEWVKQYKTAYGKKPEGTPDIIFTKSIAYEYSDVTVPANPTCVGEDGKGINLITISKGMNVDGKISIDKLMELKSEELKKEADKIQLDITNEEEMDLIKRIEEQEELINGLATQIKQLLDNEKIKADEILARQEEERKQLEEKERIKQKEKDLKLKNKNEENEITIDEFKVIIQTDTQKIVDKAFEDLNAKFQKLQDDIVRLTGSI